MSASYREEFRPLSAQVYPSPVPLRAVHVWGSDEDQTEDLIVMGCMVRVIEREDGTRDDEHSVLVWCEEVSRPLPLGDEPYPDDHVIVGPESNPAEWWAAEIARVAAFRRKTSEPAT